MRERIFRKMIEEQWDKNRFVCVGLDSDRELIPKASWRKTDGETLFYFNCAIIDATCDLVCAYKPNFAFYEGLGLSGLSALIRTVAYIKQRSPDVLVIGDTKADIGNTNREYVKSVFEVFGFDAVTVNPYLGIEALQPFLNREEKGIFVLCRTSNPGAGEFQDLPVTIDKGIVPGIDCETLPLYQWVAHQVATEWNRTGNCGLVVGATYPEALARVRQIAGDDMPILIPGIGAQGGSVHLAVKYGMSKRKRGAIYSSGRAIIFASKGSDFAQAARRETIKLHEMIRESI